MMVSALAYGLDLVVLVAIARCSNVRGLHLFWALLALSVGVGVVSLMIEAVAFGVISWADVALGSAVQSAIFALLSALATLLAGKRPATQVVAGMVVTPLRIVGVIAAYVAVYFAAGMLAYPFVAEFYAARRIPPLWEILSLQAVRSVLFVAYAALILRAGLRFAPWLIGSGLAIMGGLAPLLPDNPFMPAEVRHVHMIEVTISNFVFGAAMTWLTTWRGRAKASPRAPVSAGA